MSTSLNNPKFLSSNEAPTAQGFTPTNQLIDDTDFPHSGLFKVLNLAITGNYATAGFNATAVSNTSITVAEGTVFRQGKIHQVDYANNATTQTLTIPATANRYHLLVNPSSAPNTLTIRQATADNQIPNFTAGDVVIAVLKGGTTPMQIQYLTFNQESNTLSLGRSNSGTYVEGLEIVANAGVNGDYDINLKESNGDLAINTQAGTQALRVDGQYGNIRIGGSGTPVSNELEIAGSSSNSSARSPTLELENNNAHSTASRLLFMRQSASLSNNASLGDMVFIARDSGNSSYEYTRIEAQIADETASAGDGRLIFFAQKAGSEAEFIRIDGNDGVVINDGSADIDFRVESNGNANMLVVDASTDRIGIGTATPAATVDIAGDLRVTNNIFQQYKDMTNNLSVGWHTVAHIKGRSGGSASGTAGSTQRGIAQIIIKEESSSRHALYEFKVNHLFGTRNAIQLENSAYFSTKIIQQVRVKENDTYDGAVFQIYVADATNNLQVFITDNFADSGWVVNDAVADADNSGHNSLGLGYNNAYSTFGVVRTYNLDDLDVVDAGTIMGGNTFIQGNLKVNTGGTFRSPRLPTVAVSASTTLTESTHAGAYLICAGNVSLPATSSLGEHYTILNTTNGNITVSPSVSTNINGGSNGAAITVATYNAVTCISIGSNNWIALGV